MQWGFNLGWNLSEFVWTETAMNANESSKYHYQTPSFFLRLFLFNTCSDTTGKLNVFIKTVFQKFHEMIDVYFNGVPIHLLKFNSEIESPRQKVKVNIFHGTVSPNKQKKRIFISGVDSRYVNVVFAVYKN